MSKARGRKTRRQVRAIEDLSEQSRHLYEIVNKEPDLVCVVVGASYLDAVLENVVGARFRACELADKIMAQHGGTFGARIELAYAVGAIDEETRDDLRLIRDMRNRFAHSHLQLTFGDQEAQAQCAALKGWRILGVPLELEPELVAAALTPKQAQGRARTQFNLSAVLRLNTLLIRGIDLRAARTDGKSKSS